MEKNNQVKLLLVDDRPENLHALKVILANEDYLCVKADSGEEALKILQNDKDFAIILMDVQMPMMDGFETVELIRRIETVKHVPIIFLTASMDTSAHIFKGYKAGAVDFMIKPLSAEILRAKVAVFVDLHRKSQELLVQREQMTILNDYVTATNKGLALQNIEKEKIAAELIIANKELVLQNEEKEKQSAALQIANKELMAFNYISSHDLQEPLRKIQTFILMTVEEENLPERAKENLKRIQSAAERMQQLIEDLLAFSKVKTTERKFEKTDPGVVINEIKEDLKDIFNAKHATIEATELCPVNVIAFQFRQLLYNLISNALKFSKADVPPVIQIKSRVENGSKLNNEKLSSKINYYHISVKDNGIGFEAKYSEQIFEVFKKLHSKDVYIGTGIGLAIVKKIVENHNGIITATGELNKGVTFDIYIPANEPV
ncbi:MAG: hypothetical protein JWO09_3267 [Bacteroidetes bacterium]|nr:hypothetical protein [Bacteroidota bacterium]